MSDASGSAAPAPRSQGLIRSPRDFWGGIGLIALALFGIWACSDLPGMRGFAFGPGTAPRMFAYVLLALGAGIVLVGLLTDGAPLEQYTFAGPLGASLLLLVLIPLNIFSIRISHMLPGVAADVVFAAATGVSVVLLFRCEDAGGNGRIVLSGSHDFLVARSSGDGEGENWQVQRDQNKSNQQPHKNQDSGFDQRNHRGKL